MQCDITVKAKSAGPRPQKKKKNKQAVNRTVTVRAPVATQTAYKSSSPSISRGGTSVRIRHRELIGNVIGSAPFAVVNTISMNPGIPGVFPWLSSQARGWEMFKFNSLSIRYMTRTSTSTIGSILMSPDYDAVDSPPTSEQFQATYMGTVEFAPWKDNVMRFDTSAMNRTMDRHYLLQSSTPPTGVDIKTYTPAVLYVSAVDFATTGTPCGKLWVEYDVTLFTPQLVAPPPLGSAITTDSTNPPTPTAPFGPVPLATGNQITVLPGPAGIGPFPINLSNLITGVEYALNMNLKNATGLGGAGLTSLGPAAVNTVAGIINSTATQVSYTDTFTATAPTQSFQYTTGNAAATFGGLSSILLTALSRGGAVV